MHLKKACHEEGENMGFDEIINRKGTFCTQWDYVKDRFGTDDLLPFTISDTDFAMPPEVSAQILERMQHPIFGYTRWNHPEFKVTVARWYDQRFATTLQDEWIMYSPTVIYSIAQLIALQSKQGEGVVVQTPAYDAFFKCIVGNGRSVVENPLKYEDGMYTIDFVDLACKLAHPQNTILLLCSPHNPTGRVWCEAELKEIVALCKLYDVFIISDEIHMDIVRKDHTHVPLLKMTQENIAIVSSGSKTFNFPGLVYSYVIIPDLTTREKFMFRVKSKDGLSSASTLGLVATMRAYELCSYWVDELNDYVEQNIAVVREFFRIYLPNIVVQRPEATYFMWIDIRPLNMSMTELQERFITKGKVAIMRGDIYGGNGAHFIRLNIGCPREKLRQGLKRIRLSVVE